MSQPPYGDPNQPGQPDRPYAYPPPVDPFATSPQPPVQPQPPAQPPAQPRSPAAGPAQPPVGPSPGDAPTAAYPTVPHGFGPQPGYPQAPPPPPPPPTPKKSRALLIVAITLGLVVLLCGGGGTAAYLLLRKTDTKGEADPKAAVQKFLAAVYTEHDVDKANQVVCGDSRDKDALAKKIREIRAEGDKHKDVSYTWAEPTVLDQKPERAKVSATVRMTTGDEKASEQALHFVVVKETGWLVCEVQPAS